MASNARQTTTQPDPRHAEIIVDTVLGNDKVRSIGTPFELVSYEDGDEKKLSSNEATVYRGCVARGNYLAQDRTDVQYAVK